MATELVGDVEMVVGERTQRHGESFFKKFTAKYFYILLNKLGDVEIPRNVGDFRIVTRKALDLVLSMKEPTPFLRGLFASTGLKTNNFYYERQPRVAGESGYSLKKMIFLSLSALIGFSTAPLKWLIRLGFLLLFFSFILFGFGVFYYLVHGGVSGWLTMITSIYFFGSLNFITLGLIGNYLLQSLEILRNRPSGVISSQISN
jgi:dolichol-phosphate mannosyltransferase